MDMEEFFPSALETIKGWIYTCALIILAVNLFTAVLPDWLVTSATIGTIVVFAWDLISTIISTGSAISEEEVTVLGVISLIIEIILLVFAIILFFTIDRSLIENLTTWQWIATCMVGYHYSVEIVSMPFEIIALLVDDC